MAPIKWNLKRTALIALLMLAVGAAGTWSLIQKDDVGLELVPVNIEKTFDSKAAERLSIRSDASDIRIVRTSSAEIQIRLTGEYPKYADPFVLLNASIDSNRTLNAQIRMRPQFPIGVDLNLITTLLKGHGGIFPTVTVELPEKKYESISVKSNTGDIFLASVESAAATAETDTGDIELEGFRGDRLQVSSKTGDMRLQQVQGEVALESNTGDVELHLGALERNVSAKTDTGDVVFSAKPPFAAQLDLHSDTGRISANVPVANLENREKHQLKANVGIGGPLVKIRSATGDITVENR